ncbi:HNH endonuclease [Variovorax paradoxus]|uniref:HNH nuclease n=1 Tax=Variovorax paradoxus (strain EPS) TaxID=595537 RepID=E6VA78_VARPE|nr:HNH endonuclease [Variovorax paradoxus]ADU38550.1 HNH nuclease [Variovorax paradoxus EPS]
MPDLNLAAPSFVLSKVYRRKSELHEPFGGSRQSGISESARFLVVFLFTGDSGERYGYSDRFDEDGTFFFTGEGQRGDMLFKRGNLAIRDHSSRGKALHLFRTIGKGKGQKYLGEFVYQDHEWIDALDVDKKMRKAIVFRLVPVARLEQDELTGISEPLIDLTLDEARRRAIAAAKVDASKDTRHGRRTIYERSRIVRDYVLRRASGICELCEKSAPFRRTGGSAYLEPHHTTRVSDGGPDHPQFVAALCPACHREVHYGEYAQTRNKELIERLLIIEPKENR